MLQRQVFARIRAKKTLLDISDIESCHENVAKDLKFVVSSHTFHVEFYHFWIKRGSVYPCRSNARVLR